MWKRSAVAKQSGDLILLEGVEIVAPDQLFFSPFFTFCATPVRAPSSVGGGVTRPSLSPSKGEDGKGGP